MTKESQRWNSGAAEADYYEQFLENTRKNPLSRVGSGEMKKIIKPEEMPWERSRHGLIKHMINEQMAEKMHIPVKNVDIYMQEIPPGGRSGKHRHMSEECLYIIEGRGYDLHWDVDPLIKESYTWVISDREQRYDWRAGAIVFIPLNTVHQHVNADPQKPARIISVVNRAYNHLGYGYNDLEQLEDAPDRE